MGSGQVNCPRLTTGALSHCWRTSHPIGGDPAEHYGWGQWGGGERGGGSLSHTQHEQTGMGRKHPECAWCADPKQVFGHLASRFSAIRTMQWLLAPLCSLWDPVAHT